MSKEKNIPLFSLKMKEPLSDETTKLLVEKEYESARKGLIAGLIVILFGVLLCIIGVAGGTSWTTSILGFESSISDATPGVVIAIVGLVIVFITRPKVEIK